MAKSDAFWLEKRCLSISSSDARARAGGVVYMNEEMRLLRVPLSEGSLFNSLTLVGMIN